MKTKLGSRFIIKLDNNNIDEDIIRLIQDYKILGIIFDLYNFDDIEELRNLIKFVKNLANYNLLIGIDFFNKKINPKVLENFFYLPYPIQLTATNNKEYIIKYAEAIAKNLQILGANFFYNVSGTLDPLNYQKNKFSFGTNLTNNINYLKDFIAILSENNVITAISDFPGTKNSTYSNSRYINTSSFGNIFKENLKPYISAFEQNIDITILNNHIFPSIEKDIPISLSKELIKIIKNELNQHFITLASRPLEDEYLINFMNIEDIVKKQLEIGIDIIILDRYYEKVIDIIEKNTENPKIVNNISTSQNKIDFLRKKIELANYEEIFPTELEDTLYSTFMDQIFEESITIYTDPQKNIPLKLKEHEILGIIEPETITQQYLFSEKKEDIFYFSQYMKEFHPYTYQIIPDAKTKWDDFDTIIYCIDQKDPEILNLLKKLEQEEKKLILVFTDDPNIYDFYKDIKKASIIFTYRFLEPTMRGLVNILSDKFQSKAIYPL